ncbi:hypothetical protein [Thalassomonas sp. M1454]|uniref:hypothetical protein n=1 Tax=Thalassomonas sp. M1454 TaxID=2594477 RepID=UPI00117EBEE9|nr:hypothetical protein [Thalassomonas sp. M1454]TRX58109.1 hypothetical protein FNN08_01600 [Thalassomonas sp. M1454]
MAEFVNWFIPIVGFVVSAFVAYKYQLWGLAAGAVLFELSVVFRLEALMYFDSNYTPGVSGATSVISGVIIGLVWCTVFYFINLIKRRKFKKESLG